MSFLAFPLRLENGFLRRCEESEAFQKLMEVMGLTPYNSWAGSLHFGLREGHLEGPKGRPDRLQEAVRETNLALADLGITDIQLDTITPVKGEKPGQEVEFFEVKFRSTVDNPRSYSAKVHP
jgi:hypothetical protein